MFKGVLKRTVALFAAAVSLCVIAALGLWRHHTSIVERCDSALRQHQEPGSCLHGTVVFHDTIVFIDWLSLARLGLATFLVCLLAALSWSWARRRRH